MVKGATGQSEKAYFCEPLKYKRGKQWGTHKFLYIPHSPGPLLGRDFLEQLGAEIGFANEKITVKVNGQEYIQVLSLALVSTKGVNQLEDETLNQVYPRVWASDAPGRAKAASPVHLKLKDTQRLVRIKQHSLKQEDKEGIRPVIENSVQLRLLRECESR